MHNKRASNVSGRIDQRSEIYRSYWAIQCHWIDAYTITIVNNYDDVAEMILTFQIVIKYIYVCKLRDIQIQKSMQRILTDTLILSFV